MSKKACLSYQLSIVTDNYLSVPFHIERKHKIESIKKQTDEAVQQIKLLKEQEKELQGRIDKVRCICSNAVCRAAVCSISDVCLRIVFSSVSRHCS